MFEPGHQKDRFQAKQKIFVLKRKTHTILSFSMMTLDPATTTKVTTHTFNCLLYRKMEEDAPFERSIH